MEAALQKIKELAVDEATRQQLVRSLRELADSFEGPSETLQRYGYLHLQTAAVRTGFDLGLFKHLASAIEPLTIGQLAQDLRQDTEFINRFVRYLAAIGAIKELDKDLYAANNVTKNLTETVTEAGISHCFDTIGPQYQAMPAFLRRTGYTVPVDELKTVFQDAWQTSKHTFSWIGEHPENLGHFNRYMASRRAPEFSWLAVYPMYEELKAWNPNNPLYVNIGGGIGHQCAELKARFPELSGRVILQDLPHSIAKAMQTPGVENMAHDMFGAQPVQGAKFYYSRTVMHNWPDHKVRQLLERTKAAMNADSVMLIDEIVLPETGVSQYLAAVDLTMMGSFAGMERTERQWSKLLGDVNLKLVNTYTYNTETHESVMDVRLP